MQINKSIGSTRFVFNHFLAKRQEVYKTEGKGLSYGQCSNLLTQMKQTEETHWLKEVDKFALQNSLRDLETAYKNFFEKQRSFRSLRRSMVRSKVTARISPTATLR